MDFTYDEEQQALREAVRGLVGKSYSDFETRRRTVAEEPGFDEKLWTRLAEMGVLGLPFDEAYGGMGAGPVEVGIVAQELGRVVAPEPFLTSVVLAGGVVSLAGTEEQKASILEGVASGAGDGESDGSDIPEWARVSAPTYLNLRKASIYGGSNEIQRQIIAGTILGL